MIDPVIAARPGPSHGRWLPLHARPWALFMAGVCVGPAVLAQEAGAARSTTLVPSLSISETYTDNALLRDDDKRGDLVTQLTAGLSLGHRSARLTGSLDYSVSGSAHARETKANEVLSTLDKAFVAGANMYPKTGPVVDNATLIKVNDTKRTSAEIGLPGEEDLFKFKAATAGTYTIETRGDTDVFMILFGHNSLTSVIAEDDDSGLATNARISRPLSAGEYFIQIRHYNQQQGTGKYSITVKKS